MLFQPTSISPDRLGGIGNGVVSPDSPLVVSWLVNGNSAMTAFQIDLYYNDAESALIYSTGKLTTDCPFYGTDALGNRQFFTYTDTTVDLSTTDEWKMVITQWWSDSDYVAQASPSTFVIKDSPSLFLNVPATVARRDYTFTATYSQAQGDALNWVRWQIAINSEDGRENPLYDSGNIYGTALLECYYDGFFSGTSYCIKCMAETQSGIDIATEWTVFACEYTQTKLVGEVVASCVCDRTGVLVSWDGTRYIYGEADGDYSITDGILTLPEGSTVTWDELNGSQLELETPWYLIYKGTLVKADATLFTATFGSQSVSLTFDLATRTLTLTYEQNGTESTTTWSTVSYDSDITCILTPTQFSLYYKYLGGGLFPAEDLYTSTTLYPSDSVTEMNVSDTFDMTGWTYSQTAINSIVVGGEQQCDFIQVINGNTPGAAAQAAVLAGEYTSASITDGTIFFADFVESLNAGSLYVSGTEIIGWAVYRQQKDNSILMHITNAEIAVDSIYDYSACSQQGAYKYYIFPIGSTKYITSPIVSNEVNPIFWNWSILECSLNDDGSYEVENEFIFGKNLETGSMSNGNAPAVFENFTRYPLVQLSPQRYKSGSLSSYIGNVSNGEYSDTISQREAIDELSNTTNSLFLKNRKGDLWEIRISDAISYDTDDNTREQATTVSLSWVQIADASEVSIIQATS